MTYYDPITCKHELNETDECVKCGKDFLYDNGHPIGDGLINDLNAYKKRVHNKNAVVLVIDGGFGSGKTTLGVHCADYLEGKLINLDTQLARGGDEFQDKLDQCVKMGYKVIVYDEAGDFDKRGALTTFNKLLNRSFDICRQFGIIIILCLPVIKVLDEQIFYKGIVRGLLHCGERTAVKGVYKTYSLEAVFIILEKMMKTKKIPMVYNQVYPNYSENFLDLKPERQEQLEKISLEGKRGILSENVIKAKGYMNIRDMARKLLRSTRWIKDKIKKHDFKSALIFKRTKYYDQETYCTLEAEKQETKR
jgi:hypothetical protein